jgi:hypothetical protein
MDLDLDQFLHLEPTHRKGRAEAHRDCADEIVPRQMQRRDTMRRRARTAFFPQIREGAFSHVHACDAIPREVSVARVSCGAPVRRTDPACAIVAASGTSTIAAAASGTTVTAASGTTSSVEKLKECGALQWGGRASSRVALRPNPTHRRSSSSSATASWWRNILHRSLYHCLHRGLRSSLELPLSLQLRRCYTRYFGWGTLAALGAKITKVARRCFCDRYFICDRSTEVGRSEVNRQRCRVVGDEVRVPVVVGLQVYTSPRVKDKSQYGSINKCLSAGIMREA